MLKIRLSRFGRKNIPHFRIVVAEHSKPVKGQYLEKIGFYNPKSESLSLNKEKANIWMDKGAKPSNTVAKLLKKEGLKHPAIVVKVFKAKSKTEIEVEKTQEEEERRKREAEKEAQKAAWEEKSEEIAKEHEEEKKVEEEAAEKEEITEGEEKSPSAKATGDKEEKPASSAPKPEIESKADESSSKS